MQRCGGCHQSFETGRGLTRHRLANKKCAKYVGLRAGCNFEDYLSEICAAMYDLESQLDGVDEFERRDEGTTPLEESVRGDKPVPAVPLSLQQEVPRVEVHGMAPLHEILSKFAQVTDSWTRNELYRLVASRCLSKGQLGVLLAFMRDPKIQGR